MSSSSFRQAGTALILVIGLAGCTVGDGSVTAGAQPSGTRTTATSPTTSSPHPTTTSASPTRTTTTRPVAARPVAGTCRLIPPYGFAYETDNSPIVDCTSTHTAETYYVGDAADLDPSLDTDDRPTYAELRPYLPCTQKLDQFTGGLAWFGTMQSWSVFWPDAHDWAAGARWYRCDTYIGALGDDGWRTGEELTRSVANTSDDVDFFLAHQLCESYDGADDLTSEDIACTEPHTAELLPTAVDMPGGRDVPYPDAETITAVVGSECNAAMVAYVGQTRDDVGTVWWPPTKERWDLGDRRVICGVEAFDGRITGSLYQLGGGEFDTIPFDETTD